MTAALDPFLIIALVLLGAIVLFVGVIVFGLHQATREPTNDEHENFPGC